MAGLFELNELEARKRALAAESEVYRQMLGLEVRNLRLYSASLRKKLGLLSILGSIAPLVPLASSLFASRAGVRENGRSSFWGRYGQAALAGWRLARRIGPLARAFRERRQAHRIRLNRSKRS